jgi:two-component system, OmpR family, response regulator
VPNSPPLSYATSISSASNLRVLLVEDDAALGQRVQAYLTSHRVDATHVADLASARALLTRQGFDVVVLDLMLNDGDGMDLAREVSLHGGPPIVITSARVEEADRVLGLELGADDYMVKPYSFRELLARIRVVHRRRSDGTAIRVRRVAVFAGWRADLAAHRLTDTAGREIALTEGEFVLLVALLNQPHRVLTRATLLALTNHDDAEVFDRTIDVLVARLRRKLETADSPQMLIQTVRGEGYRFSVSVSWHDTLD